MTGAIVRAETPEERDHTRYLGEIEERQRRVAELRTDLQVLKDKLGRFNAEYHTRVGMLFIELDKIQLSIREYEHRIDRLRSDGRDQVRTKANRETKQGTQTLPNACRECGTIIANRSRTYCDDCLPAAKERSIATFSETGRQRLTDLRAQGREPSRGGEARRGASEERRTPSTCRIRRIGKPRMAEKAVLTPMYARFCPGSEVSHSGLWQA